ncbi:accessory gene regulator ArgB-like protein [Paenibacillus rhizophilus]|nr:accessory gene regulator B family protein [Paenibacillus rhizophilus]
MIDALAGKIASAIKRIVPDHPASEAVLKFSLSVVLNAFFIIILSLLVSLTTGRTNEVLMILVSFAALRQLTGGAHLKSGTACVIFTSALFTILSYVDLEIAMTQIINAISLLLIIWLAPIGIERQTRIPKRHWPKMKVVAVLLVIVNIFTGASAIAVCFFVQSLSLIIARKGVKW